MSHLVPPEPLPNAREGAGHLGFNVCHVVELARHGVRGRDGHHLPVELAVVDHGQHPEGLHGRHAAAHQSRGADLHHVNGVVVAEHLQGLVRDR